MDNETRLLGSRRSYEYRMDDLRLSLLSAQPVQQALTAAFGFQLATVGSPTPTFGPILGTIPPGLVFNFGAWTAPGGEIVPIRFLHFEVKRIVIDIAGPSTAIDGIFETIRGILSQIPTSETGTNLRDPESVLDYSEYQVRWNLQLMSMLDAGVRKVLDGILSAYPGRLDGVVIPTYTFQLHKPDEDYTGTSATTANSTLFQLAFRAGTRPTEGVYFSSAPLDSKLHALYLQDLERVLERV